MPDSPEHPLRFPPSPAPDSRRNGNGIRVSWSMAAQIVAWLVGTLLAYGAMNVRVAVMEDRVSELKSQLKDIQADVKSLLSRKP